VKGWRSIHETGFLGWRVGAHNDEILARLGYVPAHIDDLREKKII
jgi:hypothetical protein